MHRMKYLPQGHLEPLHLCCIVHYAILAKIMHQILF